MLPVDLARFDWEWKHGDRTLAREMAREYVATHHGEIAPHLEGLSLEEIVGIIDQYRRLGREADRIVADMWLLSQYAPQGISGAITIGGQSAVAMAEAIIRGEA